MPRLNVIDFGHHLVSYSSALRLQESFHSLRRDGVIPDTLILLQHHPVYTIGKRGKESDFRLPMDEVAMQTRAEIHTIPRGGQVTFHGPGQLVAYPILSLKGLQRGARSFVEGLEDTVVRTTDGFGVMSRGRVPNATGVWVGEKKIAAIGVRISQGCTTHGLALNVSTDLSYFDPIIPCGMDEKQVTSLEAEIEMDKAAQEHQRKDKAANEHQRKDKAANEHQRKDKAAKEHQRKDKAANEHQRKELYVKASGLLMREFLNEFGLQLGSHRSLTDIEELLQEL